MGDSYLEKRMDAGNQRNKADAGKIEPRLLIEGFPRSLLLAAAVLTYGKQKYEEGSWKLVEKDRWRDAKYRHMFSEILGEPADTESGLIHDAHELCNAIIILEQKLQDVPLAQFKKLLKFKKPPQDHKHG